MIVERPRKRRWYNGYLPGWFVWGGSSGGGAGTVQTDGVTIQGDGSAGNKIAIKAVQINARLTGAGTVASKLDIAGWPLTLFGIGGASQGLRHFAQPGNTVSLWGFILPYALTFSNITIRVNTGDPANNCDVGIYNSTGTLVAHVGAQIFNTTGLVTLAVVGGPFTINPGQYFLASTSVANTALLDDQQGDGQTWGYVFSQGVGASVGGALPASVIPPAESLTSETAVFALS